MSADQDPVKMPEAIKQAEKILKDGACDYLILMTDGTHIFAVNSSRIAALGLSRYAQIRAEKDLLEESYETE